MEFCNFTVCLRYWINHTLTNRISLLNWITFWLEFGTIVKLNQTNTLKIDHVTSSKQQQASDNTSFSLKKFDCQSNHYRLNFRMRLFKHLRSICAIYFYGNYKFIFHYCLEFNEFHIKNLQSQLPHWTQEFIKFISIFIDNVCKTMTVENLWLYWHYSKQNFRCWRNEFMNNPPSYP